MEIQAADADRRFAGNVLRMVSAKQQHKFNETLPERSLCLFDRNPTC